MLILLGLGISIYLILALFIFIGVSKSNIPASNTPLVAVSVVVAARNEEQHIAACLESLLQQTYSPERLEIIIVDDRSQDATAEIVQSYSTSHPNLRLIKIDGSTSSGKAVDSQPDTQILLAPEQTNSKRLEYDQPHPTQNLPRLPAKKYALTRGILSSKGEIIFITDADCVVPPGWVKEMLRYFDSQTGMVVGPLALRSSKPNLLQTLIEIENYFKSMLAKAGIDNHFPLTAQGGSLAFRRDIFHALDGFASIPHSISGDDDLWLHQVHSKTFWRIRFGTSPKARVITPPPDSWRQLWRQHLRHFSASRYYPWQAKLFYLGWHFSNLLLFLLPLITLLWFPNFFLWALLALGLKLGVDATLFWRGSQVLNFQFKSKYFMPFEVFYLFDNIIIGTLAHLVKISWKG